MTKSPSSRRRIRRYLVLTAIAFSIGIFATFVVANRSLVGHALQATSHASPGWAIISVIAAFTSFPVCALGVVNAATPTLSLSTATAVELGGAFCNRIAPAGLGRGLLRLRYLRCAGVGGAEILALTVMLSIAGAITHTAGIMLTSTARSHTATSPLRSSSVPLILVAAGVTLSITTVLLLLRNPRSAALRARSGACVSELARQCRQLVQRPTVFIGFLVASAGCTALYVTAFLAALHAVGINLSIGTATFLYLTATALANAAPVPGGLGAVELTLVAGLISAGVSQAPALAAVLIFRLASFWLPSVAGGFALLWLRRRKALTRPSYTWTSCDL